jgi:hypothetical protein
MKRFLAIVGTIVLLLCANIAGAENLKTMCVPDIDEKVCVTISEKAPDFMKFPGQAIGTRHFSNGNAIQIVEHINKAQTVDAMALVILLNGKPHIIAVVVSYCPEGFSNFDSTKTHVTDSYQDATFMKTGRPTGLMTKVDKAADYSTFKKFIEGTSI